MMIVLRFKHLMKKMFKNVKQSFSKLHAHFSSIPSQHFYHIQILCNSMSYAIWPVW